MTRNTAQYIRNTKRLCDYFQANYKNGEDIVGALRRLKELTINMPTVPLMITTTNKTGVTMATNFTYAAEYWYKREFNAAFTREERYWENKSKALQ